MAIVRRPNIIEVANRIVAEFQSSVRTKLSKFCIDKLIEYGFVPKTFPHEFNFHQYSELKKSTSKLKTLLMKSLLKSKPYLTFASVDFLQLKNKDGVHIFVGSSEELDVPQSAAALELTRQFGSTLSIYDIVSSTRYNSMYTKAYTKPKWIDRYVRYLNYIFRKHHVPAVANAVYDITYDETDFRAAQHANSTSLRRQAKIKHRVNYSISIRLAGWQLRTVTDITRYNEIVANKEASIEVDAFFADARKWESMPFEIATYSPNSTFYRFGVEKVFMHLNKGIRIFNSLARKVKYASSAYSVGD